MAADGGLRTADIAADEHAPRGQRERRAEQVAFARHFLQSRGVVPRRALHDRLEQLRDAPVIHMRAGLGWGKTAAAFELALTRGSEGVRVRMATDRQTPIPPPPPPPADAASRRGVPDRGRRTLLIVDDVAVPAEQYDPIVDEIASGRTLRLVVASRGEHPLVNRVRDAGLAVWTVGTEHLRISPDELRVMARRRGVIIGPSSSEYVTRMVGGWPIVLSRFVEEAARLRVTQGHLSAALTDKLIASSVRRVISPLLDGGAVEQLSIAALADRIDGRVISALDLSPRISDALAQLDLLGLGGWQW